MKIDGGKFLKEIGVKKDQIVLDFGCGEGHYTIPAAKVVENEGKIYAFDRDKQVLDKLRHLVKEKGIENIEFINKNSKIPLKDDSIDVVLCYDVVHYMENRTLIYDETYRVLKPDGFFSLYPKHYKDDYPLMELASLKLKAVINEVEKSGFALKDKLFTECLHDDYYNKCVVLNFTPIDKSKGEYNGIKILANEGGY